MGPANGRSGWLATTIMVWCRPQRAGGAMNAIDHEASDEQILFNDVSDAALEAAADALPGAAMSFPNAPTVSILFACCSND